MSSESCFPSAVCDKKGLDNGPSDSEAAARIVPPMITPLFESGARCRACTLDLGNPEMYNTRWLLERSAQDRYSHVRPPCDGTGDTWEPCVKRITGLARETSARVILRPGMVPDTNEDALGMRAMWHELTC